MLREELRDSDIPHCTNLCERILNVWNDHLDKLQEEMAVHSHVHWADLITYLLEEFSWQDLFYNYEFFEKDLILYQPGLQPFFSFIDSLFLLREYIS